MASDRPDGLRGMLSAAQLDEAAKAGRTEATIGELVQARDPEKLDAAAFPHVHSDHTLDVAMRRLAETGLPVLPVVSRLNVQELVGTVSMQDILAAYAMSKAAPESGEAAAQAERPVALLGGVLAVLICVIALGVFLSYSYRAERTSREQRYFEAGNAALQKDLVGEAIGHYRDALSVSANRRYRLALALALVRAGHYDEAVIYLKELLRSDVNSGPANLGMARAQAQLNGPDAAISYYHHAIYGTWPDHPADHRLQARLEFVRMLGNAGRQQLAQAELISLLPGMPGDLDVKKQVAPLLLANKLPNEAADLYREITAHDTHDEKALDGLGEAEYARAHYAAARQAFEAALTLDPNDTAAKARLDACDQILALDPMRRGLGAAERYHRSQEVLARVLDVLDKCPAPRLNARIESARASLVSKPRPRSYSDAVDANTTLAEQLWAALPKPCAAMPPPDAPLSRIMARLAAR